jgi:hypothetical protein
VLTWLIDLKNTFCQGRIGMRAMQTIAMKKAALRDGKSLCHACYWAHIQKGFRESEEAVFCCFSRLRAVPFKVADCTDFSNKNVPTREQMENIALIIPTKPARKAGGFAGVGFAGEQETEEMEDNELVSVTE